jgi:hypothetical protein
MATATKAELPSKEHLEKKRGALGARRPRRRWHENGLLSRLGRLSLVGVWVRAGSG